jgi:homoserine kinase type II
LGVFTPVQTPDSARIASAYGLGEVVRLTGIPAGSVNSNYALECATGRYFLRVYEEQDAAGAEAEASLLVALAGRGVQTPSPLSQKGAGTGGAHAKVTVAGKPVAVFPWRQGTMRCQASVTTEDARRVGAELAKVHAAGEGLSVGEGRFRVQDLRGRIELIAKGKSPELAAMAPELGSKLDHWISRRTPVTEGLIHGDLFRDNVLWKDDGTILALLDFESASRGRFAFDLMVTVLAWSFGDGLEAPVARALCDGYRSIRELPPPDRAGLLAEGCVAALRFTITRITDYAMKEGIGPRVLKDWRRFAMRLRTLEDLGDAGLRTTLGLT